MTELNSVSEHKTAGLLSLPSELILEIYAWATLCHYNDANATVGPPRGALLSQICRPLRRLALSSQNLWDHVPRRSSPELTELCLSRASTAPLHMDLHCHFDDSQDFAAKKLALPHLSRARYLRLYVEFKFEYKTVNEALTLIYDALTSSPTPLLETFDVEFDTIDFADRNYSCIYLPQPLFHGAPPTQLNYLRLRQAGMLRYPPPPTMPMSAFSSAVRSLNLHNSHLWGDVDEMVEFFMTIPLLEKLEYTLVSRDNRLFEASPSRRHSPRCVRMDRLESFITGELSIFNASMAVFTYLAMPSRTQLILYLDREDDWGMDSATHAYDSPYVELGEQALREHFAAAVAAGEYYDHLHVDDVAHTISPQCPDDDDDDESLPDLHLRLLPPPHRLCLDIPVVREELKMQAYGMYLSLPIFTQVSQICVTGLCGDEVWDNLEPYKDVQTLVLYGDALLSLVLHDLLPRGGRRFQLFPALRQIFIRNDDVSLRRLMHSTSEVMYEYTFHTYLVARRQIVTVYIERSSCKGAEELAGWLRARFRKEQIVVYSMPESGSSSEGDDGEDMQESQN
ncbi:unnamed protein product [Peniophora sp. CBMAI 1063]|nr:unnamed protein product [Peniophora sp. CBMAI 1063]